MWIKIYHCNAYGPQFGSLKDGSIHEVIEPPKGCNDERGWWVMGVDEPVLVYYGEATKVRKKTKKL